MARVFSNTPIGPAVEGDETFFDNRWVREAVTLKMQNEPNFGEAAVTRTAVCTCATRPRQNRASSDHCGPRIDQATTPGETIAREVSAMIRAAGFLVTTTADTFELT